MLDDNLLFLLGVGAVPILMMAATIYARSLHRRPALAWAGPRRGASLVMPTAEETARSVRRFKEAAERSEMVDFVWERYAQGRALLLDDIRRAAERKGRKSKAKGPPPKWI